MVDHGKYIVKVSASNNGLILGTGLAAADTVETAEDQARQRAIEAINIATGISSSAPQNIANQDTISSSAFVSSKTQKKELKVSKNQPVTGQKSVNSSPSLINEKEKKSLPVNPPVTVQNESKPKKAIADIDAKFSPISETLISPESTDDNEENVTFMSEIQDHHSQPELDFSANDEESSTVESSVSNKSVNDQDKTSVSPQLSETSVTMDFSQIINQTTIELKRLGWTQEHGKKYLVATYGKKSRHLLSDEELIEFLNYLQQQP